MASDAPTSAPDNGHHDVPVEVAPVLGRDGRDLTPKVTARGLLLQALETFEPFEKHRWPRAQLAERFLDGDQQWGVKRGANELVQDWPSWLPVVIRNLMRNLQLTTVARVTKGDPSMRAWGGEASAGDKAGADVANVLIASWRQQQDHRRVISRAAWIAQAQSAVALYTTWNPSARAADESEGDLAFEALSVFEWGTDGSERIEDSDYCYVRRWRSKNDARRLLLDAQDGPIEEEPSTQAARMMWEGTPRQMVECFEYWHKPTRHVPQGFFAVFVAGHVVQHGPFPYKHGQLPLSIWKCVDKQDSPHGSTHVDDAVPVQSSLNRLHAALAQITAKSARWLKVLTTKALQEQWDGDDQIIAGAPGDLKATQIIGPPPPPALLYTQIEENERMLRDIWGINEAVVGSDASKTKNARMLEHVSELDAQKFAMTIVARDHALLRAYRQALNLLQQYVEAPRMVRYVGRQNLPEVIWFTGADLDGVDLYLEPAAGTEQTKTAQAAAVDEDVKAGLQDPARGQELRGSGQDETVLEAYSRSVVQEQIKNAVAGFAVAPDPTIPVALAVGELQLAIEQHKGNAAALPALLALLAAYQQQQAQAAQAPLATAAAEPQNAPEAAGALTNPGGQI